MHRILAIDYGTKRVGIAVTDENNIIASGLTTVHSSEVITFLKNYIPNNNIGTIVIGNPKNLDNTPSQSAGAINNFSKHVSKLFPNVLLVKVDERFTSKIAFNAMVTGGLKKKQRQNKALVDEISATIILQDYLSKLSNI